MPSMFTHTVIPICIGLGLGKKTIPPTLLLTGIACSLIPNIEAVSAQLKLIYTNLLGYQGEHQSLLFALVMPKLALLCRRFFKVSYGRIVWFLTLSSLSPSLLSSLTTMNQSIWPWSEQHIFQSLHFIKVMLLKFSQYINPEKIATINTELINIWVPGIIVILVLKLANKKKQRSRRRVRGAK